MNQNSKKYTLTGAGTEIANFDTTDSFEVYCITGTATAIGNYAISIAGTPAFGTKYTVVYDGTLDITTGSKTFSILGTSFTQEQLNSTWVAMFYYTGSVWIPIPLVGFDQQNIQTANIANNAITNSKLSQMAANTVKANSTGSTANPQDVLISDLINNSGWGLSGNSGTTPGTDFIGTTDNQNLVFKRNSTVCGLITLGNMGFGVDSLKNNTGSSCLAYGEEAGQDNTGDGLVALGTGSAQSNSGDYLTAVGGNAGISNNSLAATAVGYSTVISGDYGIALGFGANAGANEFALPNNVTKIKWRGVSYTLPSADGTAGQKLTTDGSGNLSWT